METKNKVTVTLQDGSKKEFNTIVSLERIKSKFSIGSMFISSTLPFTVGVIDSMTCYSITEHDKKERVQIKKNMKSIRNLLK